MLMGSPRYLYNLIGSNTIELMPVISPFWMYEVAL